MIARQLTDALRADRSSVLLLGPRQTGKSTLLATLDPALTINLAHEATYLEFARNPRELEERLAPLRATRGTHTVLIDEIQRLPSLLNTVQVLLSIGALAYLLRREIGREQVADRRPVPATAR